MAEDVKRLGFLMELIESEKISRPELCRRLGITRQNLYAFFRRDDMKLSCLEEILAAMGYEVKVTLRQRKAHASALIKAMEELIGPEKLKRLSFLEIAMKLYGISKKDLSEKLEITTVGINRWFVADDIAISYLYDIAGLYDLELNFKTKKKAKNRK